MGTAEVSYHVSPISALVRPTPDRGKRAAGNRKFGGLLFYF
jgi:hypothetical protein